jgi:coenzyme F420-reducing hydrogenase delta subunit/Pyruvate/2-oxoacid:ferredoxin oxidoreductase delta subunit
MSTKHSQEVESSAQINSAVPRALVLGGGIPGIVAAQALAELGADVTFARISRTPSHAFYALPGQQTDYDLPGLSLNLRGIEVVEGDRVPVLRRDLGRFTVFFEDGRGTLYDCVLLTPGIFLKPKQPALPEETELFSSETKIRPAARVAFLLDYEYPSNPALGMTAIKVASHNVENGGVSAVCFKHVPVPHLLGETLYDEARKLGVQFVRFGDELPLISYPVNPGGAPRFRLAVTDVMDKDNKFVFDCDRVVTVTGPDASTIPKWVEEMVPHGDVDNQGFALSESIHCSSGHSFASGIFIVGEATGNLDLIRGIAQARAAAANAYAWMKISRLKDQAISVSSACVGCLTCYGVCPHKAITVRPGTSQSTVEIWKSLCRACGICGSICPAVAITSRGCPDDSLLASVKEVPQGDIIRTTFVFGCERSAGLMAQSLQLPEHVRFLAVPCAGRVSEHVIWSALAAGAKGVLVVGCHHGNCASRTGTDWAAARIRRGAATGVFQQGQRRLGYATVAANEPARFQRLLREFSDDKPSG